MHTLEDLMAMNAADLHQVLLAGHPLDADAMTNTQYLGVDLSLPGVVRKLLWHTFRKTFHRDEALGELRGWNVRMKQTGIDGEQTPMRDGRGNLKTFGHYRLRSVDDRSFPKDYVGAHFLDYAAAGNLLPDLARLGRTPLVAVNAGSSELLLGWEVFCVAGIDLPLPLYWALRLQGPLDEVVEVPVPRRVRPPRVGGLAAGGVQI